MSLPPDALAATLARHVNLWSCPYLTGQSAIEFVPG